MSGAAVALMADLCSLAADLPTYKAPVAPIAPAPVFTWTGFYLGVDVGAGFGSSSWSNIVVPSDPGQDFPGEFSRHNLLGAVGGLQAAYDVQMNSFVFGVEGEIDVSGVKGSDSCFGNYGDFSAGQNP